MIGEALADRFTHPGYFDDLSRLADAAAARLYGSLNGTTGGQETKVTKNEAVAMGVGVFTIRQVQEALGVTYPQAYRVLQGYERRGRTYAGLLEKCPAVSEGGCGVPVKRHELHFLFDPVRYRQWTANTGVWLDDDPDDDTFDGFRRVITSGRKEREGRDDAGSGIADGSDDQCTYISTSFHHSEEAQRTSGEGGGMGAGACGLRSGESSFSKRRSDGETSMCARDGPGSVSDAGRKVSKGGEKVKLRSGVLPLPGVLDHAEFARVTTECAGRGGRTRLCEGCYGRLVRTWEEEKRAG